MRATPRKNHARTLNGSSQVLNRYFEDLEQFPLLSREEEVDLGHRIQRSGDQEAFERMVNSNLRLVVKIAHGYANCGLALEDLVAEGNLGLMNAARRYNPEFGAKFSTYAIWWIKQKIMRALGNQSRTIRLPLHVIQQLRDLERATRALGSQLGHEPSDEELAEHVGISPKKVNHLKESTQPVASLDAQEELEFGENTSLATMLRDESVPNPARAALESDNRHVLNEALSHLKPRERAILIARFGLDHGEPQTLEEVGEGFGVTRERIRQIQAIAIEKLARLLRKLDRVARPNQHPDLVRSRFAHMLAISA